MSESLRDVVRAHCLAEAAPTNTVRDLLKSLNLAKVLSPLGFKEFGKNKPNEVMWKYTAPYTAATLFYVGLVAVWGSGRQTVVVDTYVNGEPVIDYNAPGGRVTGSSIEDLRRAMSNLKKRLKLLVKMFKQMQADKAAGKIR